MEKLDTKTRKKAFDQLFKATIIPFFEKEGFVSVSKTSKKLSKSFLNGLSVYIYFEYKTFGSGFYDLTIAYFDDEVGNEIDDEYLVHPKLSTPKLKYGTTEDLTSNNGAEWLEEIQQKVIPFIKNHATHKAILISDKFYYSSSREKQAKEILHKKAQINNQWKQLKYFFLQ